MSFLERFADAIVQVTDSPSVFCEVAGLVTFSAAIGNRWKLPHFAGRWLYPNLWALLLADSSVYHKGAPISFSMSTLQRLSARILAGTGSREGLIDQFWDESCGVMLIPEFEEFLSAMRRDYSGGRGFFNNLYDGIMIPNALKNLAKERRVFRDDLSISLLAASTLEQLTDAMRERDIYAGLFPRMILVHPPGFDREMMALPPEQPPDTLMDQLRLNALGISGTSGTMTMLASARQLYKTWYLRAMSVHLDGTRADAWKSRLATVCLKLAMLYQLDDNMSGTIGPTVMQRATQMTDRLLQEVHQIFSSEIAVTRGEEVRKRIGRILDRHEQQDGWMDYQHILPLTKLGTKQLREELQTLWDSGMVERREIRRQGAKRATEQWRLIRHEPGENDA